jgi:hypothetical protein
MTRLLGSVLCSGELIARQLTARESTDAEQLCPTGIVQQSDGPMADNYYTVADNSVSFHRLAT